MSLRVRLSLWYSLILFVSLLAAGSSGYWRIQHVLMKQMDHDLSDDLKLVRKIYVEEKQENQLEQFKLTVDNMDFRYAIFGAGHEFLTGSEGGRIPFPRLTAEELDRLKNGATLYETPEPERDRMPVRQILSPVEPGSGEILLLSEPMERIDYVMVRLKAVSLVLICLFLILSAAGGWWMAGNALAPIDEIVRTARQIQESKMSLRIPPRELRDETGRLIETLNSMLDRIESSFNQIRRFTQDAAHELRTPLSSILSAVDVTLRRKDRTPEEYREALEAVRGETIRLQKLAEDLLTIARTEQAAERGRVEAAGACDRVVKDLSPQMEAKQLNCEIRVEPGAVSIQEEALVRVIRNLLDNAVKFSPAGGTVQITGSKNDAYTIEVKDDGPGIPNGELPNIFERFYRGSNARNNDVPGSGLGLAIAQAIARQAGGDLTAENSPGSGALFRLRLPLAAGR